LLTVNVCFICRFFHHTNLESYIEASSFVTSSRSLKGSEINRDGPDLARKRDEAVTQGKKQFQHLKLLSEDNLNERTQKNETENETYSVQGNLFIFIFIKFSY
jgi:hypothetical protein